jgi:hypothetical protein
MWAWQTWCRSSWRTSSSAWGYLLQRQELGSSHGQGQTIDYQPELGLFGSDRQAPDLGPDDEIAGNETLKRHDQHPGSAEAAGAHHGRGGYFALQVLHRTDGALTFMVYAP